MVIDYNMLASVEQVLAYFLPEAPTEMLLNFDEVCFTSKENEGWMESLQYLVMLDWSPMKSEGK